MKFFTLPTCKLLQEAGCVTESGFVYRQTEFEMDTIFFLKNKTKIKKYDIQAFTILDLIGPSEQARENAKKIWGMHVICRDCLDPIDRHRYDCKKENKILICNFTSERHAIIDLPEDEGEAYVVKSMRRAG